MIAKMNKRKPAKREMLSREGMISDIGFMLFINGERIRGRRARECSQSMTLRGEFSQAVKGTSKFDFMVFPSDEVQVGQAEIASVGSIVGTSEVLQGVANVTREEFSTLVALASGDKLRYLSCYFQAPRYGHALIASMHIGTQAARDLAE